MPSASLLQSLPRPALMRRRLRTFAMLDTIVAPSTRSFEWHPRWAKDEQVGAFKDGEGNFFFALFSPGGSVVRGFDHESQMSPFRKDPPELWPGLFDGLPDALGSRVSDPAFALDETTFCFWAASDDDEWRAPKTHPNDADIDGAATLLGCFGKNFRDWANVYYGIELDPAALLRLWWERPLDWQTLEALNGDFDERAVREEAELLEWDIDLSNVEAIGRKASAPIRLTSKETAALLGSEEFTRLPRPAASVAPVVRHPSSCCSDECLEFVVRREPTRVVLRVRDRSVAVSHENVYDELLALVLARLARA